MKAIEVKELTDAKVAKLLPDLLPKAMEIINKTIKEAAEAGNHYVAIVAENEPEFVVKEVVKQLIENRFNVQMIPNMEGSNKIYQLFVSWEEIKDNTIPIENNYTGHTSER